MIYGMSRTNNKNSLIDNKNSIKKSNELSMSKMNQGLSLNQKQLLAYAIYCTQTNGKTKFNRKDFMDKFSIKHYHTDDAYTDSDKISDLKFSISDLENRNFNFTPIFSNLYYEDGTFSVEWNERFIPHILELKDKYVMTDLTVAAKFKSSFSWILYEYLKALYGYWHKELSKEALMQLFSVENRKTYVQNTNRFKYSVLDVAIEEINEFTELKVWYEEIKVGKKITGFKIKWSVGRREVSATDKQLSQLREIHDEVERKALEYFSIKNPKDLEMARNNIMKIKNINQQIDDKLTIEKAKDLIWEAKNYYIQLENLLKLDGEKRDTSVYFNWIKGEE